MKYLRHRTRQYLRYFFRAKTIYDVHSPFLYEFLDFTSDAERLYYQFQELDGIRLQLFSNFELIKDKDPGAGSHKMTDKLTVSDVAKSAISSQEKCEWLYRVMLFLQPQTVLELGASLGIASLYLAAPLDKGTVYTMEGRHSIAHQARKTIKRSTVKNVQLIEGLFEETLEGLVDNLDQIDFVVLDGNHKYQPTINYFTTIFNKHKPQAIMVDDIYWSPEMTQAWAVLKSHQHYNVAIDFYDYGLLLHRPEIETRIELSYIAYHKKFWRLGFFQ